MITLFRVLIFLALKTAITHKPGTTVPGESYVFVWPVAQQANLEIETDPETIDQAIMVCTNIVPGYELYRDLSMEQQGKVKVVLLYDQLKKEERMRIQEMLNRYCGAKVFYQWKE